MPDTSGRSMPAAEAPRSPPSLPHTLSGWAVFLIAIAFALFQVWTSSFTPLSSLVVRSIHVGFLLVLVFARYRAGPAAPGTPTPWYDWLLGGLGFAFGLYHLIFEREIILRYEPTVADTVVAIGMILLVFEAARRAMGPGLAIVCGLFLAWGLIGDWLPAPLDHRPYHFDQWISQLYLGTEGIFGIPVLVSSTYLFLFILFGTFLQQAGMVDLFTDLAMGTVGHTRGGPAKVAVVSSGIMGTISGSGVANVMTTGMFTIPLMKRFGYRASFAGGVEATASMGGQIMPPVMGAVAFIMAETLAIPYVEVVRAAAIPALLYFVTVFWMVHLEAGRLKLLGLPKEDCPDPLAALRRQWFLLLPLAALVYLLFGGFTPLFAGTVGLMLTVILILGTTVARLLPRLAFRILFWMILGVAAASFLKYGVEVVVAVIGGLILLNLFVKGGGATLRLTLVSLAAGAENAVGVGIACTIVGVIIGVMTLTGLPVTIGAVIIEFGRQSLFLSLVLTMVTCLIFGMGIPTIPNYIITSAIAGRVLIELGVPAIVAHMFVFYFGIMADLTPPVALAAFAAASIARSPPFETGFAAVRLAIAGFVVPFMAIYAPSLMLQDGGPLAQAYGYPVAVAYIVTKALIAIGLWGMATIGYGFGPLARYERVWAVVAACLLVAAIPATDEAGIALSVAFALAHWLRARGRSQS